MAGQTIAEMLQIAEELLPHLRGIAHSRFSVRIKEIKLLPDSDEKSTALRTLLQSMSDARANQHLIEADECGPRKD
jgi:hypothetical protein